MSEIVQALKRLWPRLWSGVYSQRGMVIAWEVGGVRSEWNRIEDRLS
jgi:hypothetical protein